MDEYKRKESAQKAYQKVIGEVPFIKKKSTNMGEQEEQSDRRSQ